MELLARTCHTEQMNVQRILARTVVILGGLFWVLMAWGGARIQGAPMTQSLAYTSVVIIALVAIFIVGIFYEYATAAILAAGAVAVIVWGVVVGWEAGVWSMALLFFFLPTAIASALYAMAARMQRICQLRD